MNHWYAFRIWRTRYEKKAHTALETAGFTSFLCIERKEVRRRHKRFHRSMLIRVDEKPVLQGYALACHDTDEMRDDWLRRILRVSMVAGPEIGRVHALRAVIGIEGIPHRIPEAAMEILMQRGGQVDRVKDRSPFVKGATVRVTDGPFASFSGPVEEVRGDRVKVLLQMFGTPNEISFPVEQLEAA